MDFAGRKVVHSAHQPNLPGIENLTENGAVFADLLNDQTNICFGDFLDERVADSNDSTGGFG